MKLIRYKDWWIRADMADQDIDIIRDVFEDDTYQITTLNLSDGLLFIDVGACIGACSRLIHKLYPTAKIIAIEANVKNIPALKANIGEFSKIIHAALTYDKDVALLDTVYKGTPTTGGSIVASRSLVEKSTDKRYIPVLEPISTITLEEVIQNKRCLDLIKLDCEGSEYNILEGTTSVKKIRTIVGEFHGGLDRFNKLYNKRFKHLKLRTWNLHDHMGNFMIFK